MRFSLFAILFALLLIAICAIPAAEATAKKANVDTARVPGQNGQPPAHPMGPKMKSPKGKANKAPQPVADPIEQNAEKKAAPAQNAEPKKAAPMKKPVKKAGPQKAEL